MAATVVLMFGLIVATVATRAGINRALKAYVLLGRLDAIGVTSCNARRG
jgi:hypothetical protein